MGITEVFNSEQDRQSIMEKRQLLGCIMAGAGFVMILINAVSYLLGWDLKSPAFTIPGLVLIVTGARTARKSSWIQVCP